MNSPWLECPCGAKILHHGELRLEWKRENESQVHIICPDDSCYLREVGHIRFERNGHEVRLKKVMFYPPFSSWNLARLGRERGNKLLKLLARELVKRKVSMDNP